MLGNDKTFVCKDGEGKRLFYLKILITMFNDEQSDFSSSTVIINKNAILLWIFN